MNKDVLERALSAKGCKDSDKAADALLKLTKRPVEKQLSAILDNLLDRHIAGMTIKLGAGSYSYVEPSMNVVLDPLMTYWPDVEALPEAGELLSRFIGILCHEAGHLLYSDFSCVSECQKAMKEGNQRVKELASQYMKAGSDKDSVYQELEKAIADYLYLQQLPDMLNSLEDGAVEHMVPMIAPRRYGNIVAIRNALVNMEQANLPHHGDNIRYIMTELRHIATYGYRHEMETPLLDENLDEQQVKEVKQLCLFSRICTQTTKERLEISKLVLDYFRPLFESKAKDFINDYLEALNQTADALDQMMNSMDEQTNPSDLTINAGSNSSGNPQAKSMPQSPYSLDLPDELQDKVNQAMEQANEQDQSEGSESGSDSSDETSDGQGESDDSNSSDGGSSENGESQNQTVDGNGESGQPADAQIGDTGSSQSQSSSGSAESSASSQSQGSDESSESSESGTEQSSSISAEEMMEQERAAAEAAAQESLSEAKRTLGRMEQAETRKMLKQKGSGKAPRYEDGGIPENVPFSKMHEGQKVTYTKHDHLIPREMSLEGERAHQNKEVLQKQARKVGRQMKTLLKRQADTSITHGKRFGEIDRLNLVRAVTDKRAFQKTTLGKESNAWIQILIDASGSMWGQKMTSAISAAYMLAEACYQAEIPVSIMSHDDGYNVELNHWLTFEDCRKKQCREAVFMADSGGANRDGLAIFHAGNDLNNHAGQHDNKILLVISDGAPASDGYYGEPACQDVRNICAQLKKEWHIDVIGIGIGDDTDHVGPIYGKNAVLVPSVEDLGAKLLATIKERVIKG